MKRSGCLFFLLFLAACNQTSNYSSRQSYSSANRDEAVADAIGKASEEAKKCESAKGKKSKTNYKIAVCKNAALDTYVKPHVLDLPSYNQLKDNMLSLAIQKDKRTITKDEAEFLFKKYTDEFAYAQSAANSEYERREQAAYEMEQQRRNAAFAAGLQSLGNSMQQRYQQPSQPLILRGSTSCYTSGAWTTCN